MSEPKLTSFAKIREDKNAPIAVSSYVLDDEKNIP
jgi:hypothetical protein